MSYYLVKFIDNTSGFGTRIQSTVVYGAGSELAARCFVADQHPKRLLDFVEVVRREHTTPERVCYRTEWD